MPEANHPLNEDPSERNKAIRILARTLFQQLRSSGYSNSHVIALTSELLQNLTESIRPPR